MKPYDAKTLDEVCSLERDNISFGDFWILSDGHTVSLRKQKQGEMPSEGIQVPRATFNKMVDWYLKDQKVVRP